MAGFSWTFEIEDRLTGQAQRMDAALSRMEATSARLEKQLGGLEEGAKRTGKGFGGFAMELHSVVDVGGRVLHVLEAVGEKVFEAGKWFAEAAIGAASFKETMLVSLSTILGSGAAAERVLHNITTMAAHLPVQTGQAMQASTALLLGGFREDQLTPLLLGMSDVGAMNPGRKDEAMHAFVKQIREMKSAGVSERHLMYLSQEANIDKGQVLERIAKLYAKPVEEIEHHLKDVNPEDMVTAILQTITSQEKGPLGTLSNKLATTVDGLMSTLKSRKLELFMDLDNSPAYASFRGFLSNLVKLTDTTSGFGLKLKGKIAEVFAESFGFAFDSLSGEGGIGRLEELLERALGVGQVAFQGLKGVVEGLASGFKDSFKDATALFDGPLDEKKIKALGEEFRKAGEEVGKGIAKAVKGLKDLWDVGEGVAQVLNMLQPDYQPTAGDKNWFRKHFFHTPDGQYPGQVDDATAEEAYRQGRVYMSGGRQVPTNGAPGPAGPATVHLAVNVDARGHHDPAQLGPVVRDATLEALTNIFESLAVQTGVGPLLPQGSTP